VTPEARQKGILLLLRARGQMRAEDLAAHFGVSEKTVYRDVRALAAFGLPLSPLSSIGYELPRLVTVPPFDLDLDPDTEAVLLGTLAATKETPLYLKALQTDVLSAREGGPQTVAVRWAPKTDARGRSLVSPVERAYMAVRAAIDRRAAIASPELDPGDIFPGLLMRVASDWTLIAWVENAGAWRSYPLASASSAVARTSVALPVPAPSPDSWLPPAPPSKQVVHVWFPSITAAIERTRAREDAVAEFEEDGGHVFVYHVDAARRHRMVSRLLRYGDWFRVVSPASMKLTVARAATQIAQRHRR
jgi:predicted DNA-binding transcriptional regulator YafY